MSSRIGSVRLRFIKSCRLAVIDKEPLRKAPPTRLASVHLRPFGEMVIGHKASAPARLILPKSAVMSKCGLRPARVIMPAALALPKSCSNSSASISNAFSPKSKTPLRRKREIFTICLKYLGNSMLAPFPCIEKLSAESLANSFS